MSLKRRAAGRTKGLGGPYFAQPCPTLTFLSATDNSRAVKGSVTLME
jgi:hypothetical protein